MDDELRINSSQSNSQAMVVAAGTPVATVQHKGGSVRPASQIETSQDGTDDLGTESKIRDTVRGKSKSRQLL